MLINDKKIKKVVLITGSMSHMNEYVEKYNIKNVVIKGESTVVNRRLHDKNYRIFNILYKSSIFSLEKYRKTDYSLKNNFIMICRFDLVKNVMFAVQSFSIFLKSNPNHKLYIVGDGSYNKTEIISYIYKCKIQNNIILMGWLSHDNLFSFIKNNIDYNISTSISEGIQGTILETMICGVPTIGSNIMGNRKIVSDGYNGLLFDFENYMYYITNWSSTMSRSLFPRLMMSNMNQNVKAFVNVLNKTVNNNKLYKRLSEGCIDFINKNKSDIENINYKKILQSIV